jgi:hypothetical protein
VLSWRRTGAAAAAVALCAAGYAAWRLGYRPWAPGVVRRLPPSETLVYLDLRPLRGAFGGPAHAGSGYAAFVRSSGFNFDRDLNQLALALRGDPAHPVSACAVLDGQFGPRFLHYLHRHALRQLRIAGLAAWQFPGWARPKQIMTLALVSPNLLVVTNAANPAPDLDRARNRWGRVPPLWHAAWWRPRPLAYLAADALTLAAERHLDGNRPPWSGAQRVDLSFRLVPPGRLALTANELASGAPAASREQAWLAREEKPLAAILRQFPPAGPPLAAWLRRVRLQRHGRRLRATLNVSASQARRLLLDLSAAAPR